MEMRPCQIYINWQTNKVNQMMIAEVDIFRAYEIISEAKRNMRPAWRQIKRHSASSIAHRRTSASDSPNIFVRTYSWMSVVAIWRHHRARLIDDARDDRCLRNGHKSLLNGDMTFEKAARISSFGWYSSPNGRAPVPRLFDGRVWPLMLAGKIASLA